jgi:RNase P protein component
MCEIKMVSVEKMEDILHEEEMRNITKEVLKKTKRNREKRIAREVMLA